jgi:hypothetical protein
MFSSNSSAERGFRDIASPEGQQRVLEAFASVTGLALEADRK